MAAFFIRDLAPTEPGEFSAEFLCRDLAFFQLAEDAALRIGIEPFLGIGNDPKALKRLSASGWLSVTMTPPKSNIIVRIIG